MERLSKIFKGPLVGIFKLLQECFKSKYLNYRYHTTQEYVYIVHKHDHCLIHV